MQFLKNKKAVMKFSFIMFSLFFIFTLLSSGEVSANLCENGTTQVCDSGNCDGIKTCINNTWSACDYSDSNGDVCGQGNCELFGCGDRLNSLYGSSKPSFKFFTITQNERVCSEGNCSVNNCVYGDGTCADEDLNDQWPWASCHAGCDENSDCNDNISCTTDICNSNTCGCEHTPNDAICNDGLWCNGEETCNPSSGCQAGTPIDCSGGNLLGITSCTNDPDNNPLTWDFRNAFTSTCNEDNNQCATGDETISHECDMDTCNAECESNEDCFDTECDNVNYPWAKAQSV